MIKKILAVVLVVALGLSFGCATICKNGPEVTSKLSSTVETLKMLVDNLKLELLAGYNAEVELSYIVAKASLVAAQTLLKQVCPDPTAVADVVLAADKVIIPQANEKILKAKKMRTKNIK